MSLEKLSTSSICNIKHAINYIIEVPVWLKGGTIERCEQAKGLFNDFADDNIFSTLPDFVQNEFTNILGDTIQSVEYILDRS